MNPITYLERMIDEMARAISTADTAALAPMSEEDIEEVIDYVRFELPVVKLRLELLKDKIENGEVINEN